jgi:3D (Asp-Asp-Asp) domain-containing protein
MKHTLLLAFAIISVGGLYMLGSPATAGAKIEENAPKTLKVLSMRITAYASVPEETSDHPFITASGEHVRNGIVATNLLPFGTEIEIPKLFGDKIFIVEDRMNQRFENTIDIWMPSKTEAKDFGVAHTAVILVDSSSSPVSAISEAGTADTATL